MSKKIVLLPILVCSLFVSCKKGQNENKQTQTEIKIEESAEKVIDEDKIEESSLEDDTKTVEIEYTSNGAIPNKYFTADDVFIAKGIEETIKIIDEEHFLSYICNLIKTDAQEKIAAYAPYQEKEISKESSEPVSFEDGYTFYPETIKLQVSDKDIVTMEKYSETTYEYDDDNRMEITVEKDGLDHISKKSKNPSYY